mgnify:CR=1 FL=1
MTETAQAGVAALAALVLGTLSLWLFMRRKRNQSATDIGISSIYIVIVSAVAVVVAAFNNDLHRILLVTILAAAAISLTALARSLELVPRGIPLVVLAAGSVAVVVADAVFPATGIPAIDMPFTVLAIFGFTIACREIESAPGVLAPVAVVMLGGITVIGFGRGDHHLQTLTAAAVGCAIAATWWTRMNGPGSLGPGVALFIGFTLLTSIAALRGPFWVAAFPIASGLLVIPIADTATVFESRRKLGQPIFAGRKDHLSDRLLARGASPILTVSLLVLAALIGAVSSNLTAYKIIPWYVGLCVAWATKIAIVAWALKNPVPNPDRTT